MLKRLLAKTSQFYTYDEDGLRLTKTIGTTTHEYFYHDEVLEMEIVKENNVITQYRTYEWDGYTALGMIIKEKNANGTFQTNSYQFITNHRGDVLSIRDADDKEVGSYEYDAYGNVLEVEGNIAKENPIRYAGYYFDEETKNYYLQARYYNPENGAFLALDRHPGDDDDPLSQNGYTYVENNPVMNIDPDGLVSVRSRDIKATVNVIVAAIPHLRPVVTALKSKAMKELKKLLKKDTVKDRLIESTYKGLAKSGMKKSKAKSISKLVISLVAAAVGYTIWRYCSNSIKKAIQNL